MSVLSYCEKGNFKRQMSEATFLQMYVNHPCHHITTFNLFFFVLLSFKVSNIFVLILRPKTYSTYKYIGSVLVSLICETLMSECLMNLIMKLISERPHEDDTNLALSINLK